MSVFSQPTETKAPKSDFLMGLAPDHCIAYGEDKSLWLTTEEVQTLDTDVLRRYASKAEHPEIKGRGCPASMLKEYFCAQTVLTDFPKD